MCRTVSRGSPAACGPPLLHKVDNPACRKSNNDAHQRSREYPRKKWTMRNSASLRAIHGGYPFAIRSFIQSHLEDASNSAQTLLQTVTGMEIRRGAEAPTHGVSRS